MKRTLPTRHAALVLLSLSACTLVDKQLGELDSTTGAEESSGGGSTGDGMTSNASSPDTGGSETGESEDCTPGAPHKCSSDPDGDDFASACDNAPQHFNPDQFDIDGDGIGDVIDLCPTVAGSNNTADSDSDGIGNECDSCRHTPQFYNEILAITLPADQRVRNIPDVGDFDGDGIGDACDNCVAIANCEAYDLDNPWAPGDPIATEDTNVCQRDDDQDMIGDTCEGMQIEGASGPVGFGDDDDFDQDGLANALDSCMRLPMYRIPCTGDESCPPTSQCETSMGFCNHPDSDSDGVGDACDTCVFAPNGEQLQDGASIADDDDADFVGEVCENALHVVNPLPMVFYTESSQGVCCTTRLVEESDTLDLIDQLTGRALRDPDGLPIRRGCTEAEDPELRTCRRLPPVLEGQPGVLVLAPGCAGNGARVGLDDVGGDPAALWQLRCELPQLDQDFDGIGDEADLCPFAFDPSNTLYVDDDGMVWQNAGKYCNGEYSLDAICGE